MFYVMLDGQIAFWTYRSSQKARNLARDPRVTCLVEAGEEYFELRGVQVVGTARCIEDPAGVLEIGRRRRRRDDGHVRRCAGGVHDARPRASGWGSWWSRSGSSPGTSASWPGQAADSRLASPGQGATGDRNDSSGDVYRARSMFHDSTWPAPGTARG